MKVLYGNFDKKTTTERSIVVSVGAPGFEPGASSTPLKRATELRHAPNSEADYSAFTSRWQPPWERNATEKGTSNRRFTTSLIHYFPIPAGRTALKTPWIRNERMQPLLILCDGFLSRDSRTSVQPVRLTFLFEFDTVYLPTGR